MQSCTPLPPPEEINGADKSRRQHLAQLTIPTNLESLYVTPNPPSNDYSNVTHSLGEPVELSSPQQTSFDDLTQLPTPIINSGSFGNFSPTEPYSPLEMQKVRRHPSLNVKSPNKRVLSEYRPLERRTLNDIYDNHKRISSNPVQTTEIPSPPADDGLVAQFFSKQDFYAPRLGSNFKFLKLIGKGNFSNVILVHKEDDPSVKLAVKVISIPVKNKDQIQNFKYFLERELNVLLQLNHPNIIRLVDYKTSLAIDEEMIRNVNICSDPSYLDLEQFPQDTFQDVANLTSNNNQHIFVNYCPGGNMFEFLSKNYRAYGKQHNYWVTIRNIVKELFHSVHYIHGLNIIHRDIKLENVLLNHSLEELLTNPHRSNVSCLTDFGLARKLSDANQLLTTRCGSQDYIAPEILMGVEYNGFLTDSWSLGVLIYCLLEDRLPFDLPPLNYLASSGISPSVIKRKMTRNSPAHRIAMVDWDWYTLNDLLGDNDIQLETKEILHQLKSIVDLLLVRKHKRATVSELLKLEKHFWLRE